MSDPLDYLPENRRLELLAHIQALQAKQREAPDVPPGLMEALKAHQDAIVHILESEADLLSNSAHQLR